MGTGRPGPWPLSVGLNIDARPAPVCGVCCSILTACA